MDVMLKSLKRISLSLLLVSFFLLACEEEHIDGNCSFYNYSGCNTTEPFMAEMTMKFSITPDIPWVAFEIYEGTIDEGEVIVYDTAWNSQVIYDMPIPQYYSVKAKYELNGNIIYAIDGAEIRKHQERICDSLCWEVDETNLDLVIH